MGALDEKPATLENALLWMMSDNIKSDVSIRYRIGNKTCEGATLSLGHHRLEETSFNCGSHLVINIPDEQIEHLVKQRVAEIFAVLVESMCEKTET